MKSRIIYLASFLLIIGNVTNYAAGLKLKAGGNYAYFNNKINSEPRFNFDLQKQCNLNPKSVVSVKNHVPHYFSESVNKINQNNDSLITFTDEEIKKEVKFGIGNKIFSISWGAFWGGILGVTAGFFVDSRIHNYKFGGYPSYGSAIGLGIGMIGGAYLNYKIVYHLLKKGAKKKLKKREKQSMSTGSLFEYPQWYIFILLDKKQGNSNSLSIKLILNL